MFPFPAHSRVHQSEPWYGAQVQASRRDLREVSYMFEKKIWQLLNFTESFDILQVLETKVDLVENIIHILMFT